MERQRQRRRAEAQVIETCLYQMSLLPFWEESTSIGPCILKDVK